MDILKSIKENYLLVCAILFIFLLIIYGVFYPKKSSSNNNDNDEKKNKDTFITYTFIFIIGLLLIYAIYLIYIKYLRNTTFFTGGSKVNQSNFDFNSIKMSGDDVDIGFIDS